MNNFKEQQGSTFQGLLIGIVVAALIIVGILWYLENNKSSFQTHKPPTPIPSTPDTLPHMPNGSTTKSTDNNLNDFSFDPTLFDPSNSEQNMANLSISETNTASQATIDSITDKPAAAPKDDIEALITTIQTPVQSKNTPVNNPVKDSTAQRTPEQILNNKSTKISNNNQFIIQMGSFSKQEQAEKRKAQLSLLNISAHIQQSQNNGQTIYRLRSATLNQADAQKLQSTLNNNNIDNMLISVN